MSGLDSAHCLVNAVHDVQVSRLYLQRVHEYKVIMNSCGNHSLCTSVTRVTSAYTVFNLDYRIPMCRSSPLLHDC